ncbi:MAG: hypothetical protein ABW136_06800 [Steroidobacteraceae bacterium]
MSSTSRHHSRRLREYHRSAGWPCHDAIEIDLLVAGLIERVERPGGAVVIRVTAAGIVALSETLVRNRGAFDAHEALVLRTAGWLAAAGRLVYRGLPLRGRVEEGWRGCRPDVYSLRVTNVVEYTCPAIHEIKVRRADLFGELADAGKRLAYQSLSSEFYYVLPEGLATLDEIPADCGVVYVGDAGMRPGRPSPRRAVQPGLAEWMAIARRGAESLDAEPAQLSLREG